MRRLLYFTLLFGISLLLLSSASVLADYVLLKDVLSTSGGHIESSTYLLDCAVGQVAVGPSSGPEHIEWAGFLGWSLWGPAVGVELDSPDALPVMFALHQNYPNPFNPITHISYQLPQAGHVSLHIFNVKGQLVRRLVDENLTAGDHVVTWDATDDSGMPVASGVYFYHMVCGEHRQMRKMLLLK